MATETSKTGHIEAIRAKASQTYARHSRESLEEKWILQNLPLVRHVVQKIVSQLSRKIDTEDLISAGMLGLVKAARAYDANRKAEFRTYAYIRIRGAVIDELRGRSFTPPNVLTQIRRIQEIYQRFQNNQSRPPTDEQLAAELGISEAQLYRTLQEARRQNFLSIHGLVEDGPVLGSFIPPDSGPSPGEQAERKEMLEKLAQALAELPERDRTVLLLYYERDLTMKEAAAVLNVTESRVSQLHASALFKLSMKLRATR